MNPATDPASTSLVQQLLQGSNPLQGGMQQPAALPAASSLSDLPDPLAQSSQNQMNAGAAQNFSNRLQQVDQSNIPQRPTPTAKPKKESTFDKLLPSLGGGAAGLIGAGLAPETGGLSLLIPVVAAALGGAAGQAGQNAATGQKVIQGNDLSSGLEQGAGQLAGMGIAKGIGAAGGALKSSGEAAQKAAADAAAPTVPTAEENAAQHGQLLDAMFPHNPRGDTGQLDKMLTRIGAPIDEMAPQEGVQTAKGVSDLLTPTYDTAVNDVLGQAGGTVDLSGIFDTAKAALAKNGLRLGAPKYQTAKAMSDDDIINQLFGGTKAKPSNLGGEPLMNQAAQTLTRLAQNMELNGAINEGGGLGALVRGEVNPADPLKTRNLLSQLNDTIASYREAAMMGQDAPSKQAADSMSKVLMGVRDHVQDQLYNRPEVAGALSKFDSGNALNQFETAAKGSNLSPEVIQNVRDEATSNLTNPKDIKTILTPFSESTNADVVSKSSAPYMAGGRSASEPAARRSLEYFAKKSRPPEAPAEKPKEGFGQKLMQTGGTAEAVLRGDPRGLMVAAAPAALRAASSPAARIATGGVLSKLGSPVGIAATGGLGALVGSTPGIAAQPAAQPVTTGATPMQQQATSPYAEDLNNLIATAMLPSGGAFTSAGGNAASVLGSLGPQLLTQIQDAAKAQTAEQTVAQLLNQAGGPQGAGMGLLSRIGQSFTGGPAGMLPGQNKLGAAEANLGGILGNATPGAPAPAMPSVTSNAPTAQTALSGIQALIQSMYGQNSGVVPQAM